MLPAVLCAVAVAAAAAAAAFGGAGADQVALHIRQTAQYGNHQPAGAGRGVCPRLGQRPELPPCVHDLLDDGEQVEGRAGQPVDPRHGHHVAGAKGFQQPQQLPPGRLRAARLLAVNPDSALGLQLRQLRVERLPVGADAGIAKAAGFGS